jgi:hypothetical protein
MCKDKPITTETTSCGNRFILEREGQAEDRRQWQGVAPSAHLCSIAALHQRENRYRLASAYLPGMLNVMTDDAVLYPISYCPFSGGCPQTVQRGHRSMKKMGEPPTAPRAVASIAVPRHGPLPLTTTTTRARQAHTDAHLPTWRLHTVAACRDNVVITLYIVDKHRRLTRH